MKEGDSARWWRCLERILARSVREPHGPRWRPVAEWLLPLSLLVAATVVLRLFARELDLGTQRWIHRAGGASWSFGEHPFWKGLYHWGPWPSYLAAIGAFSGLALSWSVGALRPWRRVFAYLLATGLAGPVLITNVLLKGYWGRPRPRETAEFGGSSPFEPVLTYDPSSGGQSFPCGHATTGFYFFAVYFLLRRHRPDLARGALFVSLSLGGLLGVARMAQGGHFLSDVVWAAAVCWFVALALYHAMGLDRALLTLSEPANPMPRPIRLGLVGLALALFGAMMLASPYSERRSYSLDASAEAGEELMVNLRVLGGNARIGPGEVFGIKAEAQGHGVPTSKIGRFYSETPREGGRSILYAERPSGWFRELVADLRITLPWDRTRRVRLETGTAKIRIDFAREAGTTQLFLDKGEGSVLVVAGKARVEVKPQGDPRIDNRREGPDGGSATGLLRIELAPEFGGSLEIRGEAP
jgi:lipid A 4'-phosphatase